MFYFYYIFMRKIALNDFGKNILNHNHCFVMLKFLWFTNYGKFHIYKLHLFQLKNKSSYFSTESMFYFWNYLKWIAGNVWNCIFCYSWELSILNKYYLLEVRSLCLYETFLIVLSHVGYIWHFINIFLLNRRRLSCVHLIQN